jgi:uncharacterized protein YndB with AHSA1/START domain
MNDILHRIGIEAGQSEVWSALTTIDGLSGWWTEDTEGESDSVGGTVAFRFPVGGFDMRVTELDPGTRVVWQVTDGPDEWVGTTVEWELHREDEYTVVMFAHRGWREAVPFMHHCSTKWAIFLMSLKAFVETGKGEPAPHDVRISNWH